MSAGRDESLFTRLAADIAVRRRQVLACLLFSLAAVAPYVIRLVDGNADLHPAHLWVAVALCAVATWSRLLFGLACTAILLASLFLQHVLRNWGRGQLDARLDAMYEAPGSEVLEYLHSHFDAVDALAVAGAAAFVMLIGLALPRMAPTPRLRVAAGAAMALALGFALMLPGYSVFSFPPLGLAREAIEAKARHDRLSSRLEFLAAESLGARDCRIPYDRIVVVLGESAVTDHMGLFGYERPTTPFASRSGAHAFDALAPSNQTRISLAIMLTPTAPESFQEFFRSHSLVSELRACGFRTLWISNQGSRGRDDSLASSIATEADEQVFLNEGSWKDVQLDGAIVEELDRRRVHERRRQATFVHLIGSHTRYRDRFPEGFGFADVHDRIEQYDNSILYTDHVLSELHRRFAGPSTLFVYASDHGQVVSNGLFGTGFVPGYQEEFRTPLLIWTADTEAIEALRAAAAGSRINLESFDDIVRYLAGLSPEPRVSKRPTVSVLTPENLRDYRELASFKRGRNPISGK